MQAADEGAKILTNRELQTGYRDYPYEKRIMWTMGAMKCMCGSKSKQEITYRAKKNSHEWLDKL